MPAEPGGIFRPEALRARKGPSRPRILPVMSSPRLRAAAALVALAVLGALIVGLLWSVPRTQRVSVVGLPDGRGLVVLGRTSATDDLRPGSTVRADFGEERPVRLTVTGVQGVLTPREAGRRFRGSRVGSVATVRLNVALARPTTGGATPTELSDAVLLGTATTGHERVVDLLIRSLS